jgi:hypothetical protein
VEGSKEKWDDLVREGKRRKKSKKKRRRRRRGEEEEEGRGGEVKTEREAE